MAILVLAGLLITDLSLHQFRKIPFACSWLPGGPQFRLKLGIWMLIFVIFASLLTGIEFWATQNVARFCVFAALLLVVVRWAARRNTEFAESPANRIQFDELPPADIFALDLSPDGDWLTDEAWAGSIIPGEGRTIGQRLKRFAIGALVFITAGLIYEHASELRDRQRFPQIGRSVDIGGRSLNLYCSGEGTPTVILESNLSEPGYRWVFVQRQIAAFTRACWYDRAGLGWSDPGPFPNHSDSIAHDLHRLLSAALIPRPYVLVGYSMGAFHARVYRGYYPAEVAGMVLVDPMNEDMTIHIHNHIEFFRPAVLLIHGILGHIGFYRILDDGPAAIMGTLRLQPKSVVASGKEPPLWVSGELARASGTFGDIPVIVLSAGIQDQEEDEKLDHDHDWKMSLHARLAGLSTQGRQIVLKNAGHRIPFAAPDSVVDATREVVIKARRQNT
jgi:pimeloyl-ACP methyl ester carboxylesterase